MFVQNIESSLRLVNGDEFLRPLKMLSVEPKSEAQGKGDSL